MNKRLLKLLAKQSRLDAFIIKTKAIDLSKLDMVTNRILALNVELAELANEVRTFKHWSNKGASAKSVVIEEYVDALHFLLSVTNDMSLIEDVALNDVLVMTRPVTLDISFTCPSYDEMSNFDINNTFIALFSATTELYFAYLEKDGDRVSSLLADVWSIFSHLGGALKFTDGEIDVAYDAKYQKNIERQTTGY